MDPHLVRAVFLGLTPQTLILSEAGYLGLKLRNYVRQLAAVPIALGLSFDMTISFQINGKFLKIQAARFLFLK